MNDTVKYGGLVSVLEYIYCTVSKPVLEYLCTRGTISYMTTISQGNLVCQKYVIQSYTYLDQHHVSLHHLSILFLNFFHYREWGGAVDEMMMMARGRGVGGYVWVWVCEEVQAHEL